MMNPYDNVQPWRDSVGRGRQRTLPAWMATPSLDRSSTISGTSAPPWSDSNGIARGRQRTLPAWMTTPRQTNAIPPPPPPYETYQPWNSRHPHTLLPMVPPPPPPPPLPTQPVMVHLQQTSLPSFWQLSKDQKKPLPAPPSQYSIPYLLNSAFTNPPLTSGSGSDERADIVMIPDGHALCTTNSLQNIAPINDILTRNAHKDENNIKIHHNDEDSKALFSSLSLGYESRISSKNKSDSLLKKERVSDHPHIATSASAITATRTNSVEEDDMDIEESDIEHEVTIDFIGGGDFYNLLSNTRVSRRKKIQVLWTRTIQFASSFPEEIPNSIRNSLLELAARTRKKGHLIKLIPEQRRPFLEYCVKTLKVSPKLAGEIFSFLESKRVSEFRWKKALESYEISSCDDAVVRELISRLKSLAQKGLLCPRNKDDYLYFCNCCFPPITVGTCDQVYDFLVSHIPEFSAYVVRRPWDCMSSMQEKITMLPNWSQNEKMLFVIEHLAVDELDFFCPFRSLLLALQSQLKQFSESIFSYRGVSNRKKFFKYCKETCTKVAETDVRRAFQFISKKIKEYESQALRENVSHDGSDQSDESDRSEIMKAGQKKNTRNVTCDQGDEQSQIYFPNSLALSRISEQSAILEDPPVRKKPSEIAGLSGSKDSSINKGVDSINCQGACTNTFRVTQAATKEDYEVSLFEHSYESGKRCLSTAQQLGEDDEEVPKKAQPKKLLLGRIAEIATTADDVPVSIQALLSKLASQSNNSDTKVIVDAISFQNMCIRNFNSTQAEAQTAYKFLLSSHKKDVWHMRLLAESNDKKAEKEALKKTPLKLLTGRIAELTAAAHDGPVSIKPLLSKLATLTQSKDSSMKTIVYPSTFHNICINTFHATQAEAEEAYNFLISRQTEKVSKIPRSSCSDNVLSAEEDKEAPKKVKFTKLLLGRIIEIATTADDAPDSIRGLLSKFATDGEEIYSSTKTIVDAVSFERMCMNNFHATEAEAKEAYEYLLSRQRDSEFSKSLVNQLSLRPLHEKNLGRQRVTNSTVCVHLADDLADANRHKVEISSNKAQEFSANLAPLEQCTGLQHSGLLFQQSGVTPKRDNPFHPSSFALKNGAALEHKYYDEIDTSRHPENMNTDLSSTSPIQFKSTRMNLKAETIGKYNDSDKHSAIQSEEEASSIQLTPSFDINSKVITVKDKPLHMRKISLPSVSLLEQEAKESRVLTKKSVGDAITDDPLQLVLVPDIASRRQKLLQSMRAAKEKEARAITELPKNKTESTIACRESHRKFQRISYEMSSFDANGFRIDCQGDAATCQHKPEALRGDFTSTNDDESKERHQKMLQIEDSVDAEGGSSADESITEYLGDAVKYPSLPLASRRKGKKVGVTATTIDREAWENDPKVIKSNFAMDAFQCRSVDGLKKERLDNIATCPAFQDPCGQESSNFFQKDLDHSTPIPTLGADIVARRKKLRQSVMLQEKELRLKLDSSGKKISQAFSTSEQEARERVLKSLKEKGPLNASRRFSADGFKTELQIDAPSYESAATTDQETRRDDFLGILEDKYSFDASLESSVDGFGTEFIPVAHEQETRKCIEEKVSFDASRRALNDGLKKENGPMVFHSRLPKEITALSQKVFIRNISNSGPPTLIRTVQWPASGTASNSVLDIEKVGTERSKSRHKRKLSSLAESEIETSERLHLQPPFDEQVGDVQRRGDELHKKLALLKERLKEKKEKLLLQCDPQLGVAEDQSSTSVLPNLSASPSEMNNEVVAGKSADESQNVSINAELKNSDVSSRFQSISSLRQRQQQLRQTIELNNLKNFASKQKSLLSEQKIRLKESMQLLDECSTEVKRYEGLVDEGRKRIADLDRRQKLLLGMLSKATKNVLDARRAFKEAAENLKISAE